MTAPPDLDPAEHAAEHFAWPGLADWYLVHAGGRYYAWSEYADPPRRDVAEFATAAAARQHLAASRARSLLALGDDAVVARAEARCFEQDAPLFAAVVATPGGDGQAWLATWDATDAGGHTLTGWGSEAAAVGAFAAVTEEAAARIEHLPVSWPDVIAAHLRYRIQVARTASARAALGDALRAHNAEIQARGAERAARLANVGASYLYRVLRGEDWTWAGATLGYADLRSGARRRTEARQPGATLTGTDWPAHAFLAVAAAGRDQAAALAGTVLEELHLVPVAAARAEPLRAGLWTVRADIEIPGQASIDPGDAHSRAVHLAALLRGAANWTLREGPGHIEAEWPPDIWSGDPGGGHVLVDRAVRAAVIRAVAPRTAPRPRRRYPARRTDVQGRSQRALGPAGRVALSVATDEFEALFALVADRFGRAPMRETARRYLLRLASLSDRLHGWDLPSRTGAPDIKAARRLLDRGVWSADGLRDDLRSYVSGRLGQPEATLVVAETAFRKQGSRSAGVARQYSPVARKQENCQIGVFLGYGASGQVTLIDRDLFLPEAWARDRARCRRAGIADDVAYMTKPELARALIARAAAGGVPYRWVTADRACADDPMLPAWLAESGTSFVLPVPGNFLVDTAAGSLRADKVAGSQQESAWQLLADKGPAGPAAPQDWTMIAGTAPGQCLLACRTSGGSPMAFFACQGPAGSTLPELAAVAASIGAMNACLQSARNESGLDEYLALGYDNWYRHVTLSMLAAALLAVLTNENARRAERGHRPTSARTKAG